MIKEKRERFMYTDGVTGILKVQKSAYGGFSKEEFEDLLQTHFAPVHYHKGKKLDTPVITPRYVLKEFFDDTTEV